MFSGFSEPVRQILTGNLLIIGCVIFYLAWWLIADNPAHAVHGIRSGWLLIPAFILAVGAVYQVSRGISLADQESLLLPNSIIVAAGVITYLVLLAVTTAVFRRTVTSELFIITFWSFFMFAEASAFYSLGCFTRQTAVTLTVVTFIVAAIDIVCYVLYYNLDDVKGYIDGMVPLIMAGVMTGVISLGAVIE